MKNAKVIIVHGWASSPKRGWIAWLADLLRERGYDVSAPAMPNPRRPQMDEWVEALLAEVGDAKCLILVGHSLGSYALLLLARELPEDVHVERLILVAGFSPEKDKTYWPEHHIDAADFVRIRARVARSYCIYSNNDRMVEPARTKEVCAKLKGHLILQQDMGHFSNLKLDELPIVLECITEA